MRHVPTLVRRELAAYFLGPMAFLILLAFLAIAWVNFWELLNQLSRNTISLSSRFDPLNAYISGSFSFWLGVLIAVPAVTMRLFAEEKRSGTIETLLTTPVSETEVVTAKWIAGVVMYLMLLLPFAMHLPFLYHQGHYPFDLGPLISLGIGLTTLGMMFVSIGLLFSASTKNQIVAAVWTFVTIFLMILSYMVYQSAAYRKAAWAEAAQFVSVLHQVNEFGAGRLDLRYLTLHLSVTAFLLFLTVKVVQSRREA